MRNSTKQTDRPIPAKLEVVPDVTALDQLCSAWLERLLRDGVPLAPLPEEFVTSGGQPEADKPRSGKGDLDEVVSRRRKREKIGR